MSKKFYTLERRHRIYALVDRELKVAFVGKSYSKSLASLYSKHANGKNYLTAEFFGKDSPKVKPELLVLEEVYCTGAVAYRHIIAWSLYFEKQGFLMLTQEGTMQYSEDLKAETQEIYDRISQTSLEEVLMRKYIADTTEVKRKITVYEQDKLTREKLSLRVDEEDKAVFLELKRGMGVTQREVFHLLLDGVVFENQNYTPLIRRQKNQISDLEAEVQELQNQLAQERANKKHDKRISEILSYTKTITSQYIQRLMQEISYNGKPMKPTRTPKNSIRDFAYPSESGTAVIRLDEIVYGKSNGMVFVLGWTEEGQAIKLRHYGKREFLGSDPRFSNYAVHGSWWQVHYSTNDEGVSDLTAAFPLPPKQELPEFERKIKEQLELEKQRVYRILEEDPNWESLPERERKAKRKIADEVAMELARNDWSDD